MGSTPIKKKTKEKMLASLDDLLTEEALAEKLHVSTRSLRRWRTKGVRGVKLRGRKLGGLVRYDENDVRMFIEMTQPDHQPAA